MLVRADVEWLVRTDVEWLVRAELVDDRAELVLDVLVVDGLDGVDGLAIGHELVLVCGLGRDGLVDVLTRFTS